ncbi:hypothetical protein, partial [Pseudomonas sp. NFACC02]|uniref:hypothetical protein n=1 Tax=Pseudomonas sp. NFACC02 TaxID=1566250 RepID=UPI001C48B760
ICREPAARPVHAGCQAESSRLVLLPLRGRSRGKPRSYRDCVSLMDLLLILLFDIDIPDTANRDLGAG